MNSINSVLTPVLTVKTEIDSISEWIDARAQKALVHKDLRDLAVKHLDLEETFSALNREIPRTLAWRINEWSESAGFQNWDGTFFQCRLEAPRWEKDGQKVIKYESPIGVGSQLFMPEVDQLSRDRMTQIFGVQVPRFPEPFWPWFQQTTQLPLMITEGAWKALSAIAAGIPCVSLYGCSAAFERRESKYDPKNLLDELQSLSSKRKIYIAFDQDEKPETRARVSRAIKFLSDSLRGVAGKNNVFACYWESNDGKGVDDYRGNGGDIRSLLDTAADPKIVRRNAKNAIALQRAIFYKTPSFDYVKSSRWVSDCGFPMLKPGEAVLVSAPMGTGKTKWFGDVLRSLAFDHPNLQIELIGHRNNLLRQSSKRLGLVHIENLRGDQSKYKKRTGVAYCIDSFNKRFPILREKIMQGGFVVVVIDEIDSVLSHLCTSETISDLQRMAISANLAELLGWIAKGHGAVLGGEANLSTIAVTALKKMAPELKVVTCKNEYQPKKWQVFNRSQQTQQKNVADAIEFTRQLLIDGQRVFLMMDSQAACEAAEHVLKNFVSDYQIFRADGKTSGEEAVQSFLTNVNEELRFNDYRLFIGSSTIESGVSIDVDAFDHVVVCGGFLFPGSIVQMMGRVRTPVPRTIFISESALLSGQSEDRFSPGQLKLEWMRRKNDILQRNEWRCPDNALIDNALIDIVADIKARSNAGRSILRDEVLAYLADDGHEIIDAPLIDSKWAKHAVKEAKKQINSCDVQKYVDADYTALTLTEAQKIMRSDAPHEKKIQASKRIHAEKYDFHVETREFAETYGIKGRRHRKSLEYAADFLTSEADLGSIPDQIRSGALWSPGLEDRQACIELLHKIYVDRILSLPDDAVLHADSAEVQFVFRQALKHSSEVKRLLGLTIDCNTIPMSFIGDLLRLRFGCSLKSSRKRVDGKQVRLYKIEKFPLRDVLIEAIIAYREREKVRKNQEIPQFAPLPGYPVETVGGDVYSFRYFSPLQGLIVCDEDGVDLSLRRDHLPCDSPFLDVVQRINQLEVTK